MIVDFRLLQGEDDLHDFLNCRKELADWLLTAHDDELFFRHQIPKKGRLGGSREVWEVQQDTVGDIYKGLARKLDDFIRSQLPSFPHNAAHGYIAGRSTLTNARVHIGARVVVNADIKSFFRSIHGARVRNLLRELGLGEAAAAALTSVLVREDHLPLGLPTSPLLANAVCIRLDEALCALVPGGRYSRYADDLSFSGPVLPSKEAVAAELGKEGFRLSEDKWRAARAGRGLYVTGLSIEDRGGPRVPRAMKRRLRQELHYAKRHGLVAHVGRNYGSIQSGINQIEGLISYVRGIEPRIGSKYLADWQTILALSGHSVAHTTQSPLAPRKVLFVVDESVLQDGARTVLVLALVVLEDVDVVRAASRNFLQKLSSDPYGATAKEELNAKGLHWNAFQPDDRTRATEWVRALPFRCFLGMATLANQGKASYDETYRRLVVKLIERRLVRYDRCSLVGSLRSVATARWRRASTCSLSILMSLRWSTSLRDASTIWRCSWLRHADVTRRSELRIWSHSATRNKACSSMMAPKWKPTRRSGHSTPSSRTWSDSFVGLPYGRYNAPSSRGSMPR